MRRVVAIVEDDPARRIFSNLICPGMPLTPERSLTSGGSRAGGAFLDEYQPIYDLVMMDIDLPGISGMATAPERVAPGWTGGYLVFLTNLARVRRQGLCGGRHGLPAQARFLTPALPVRSSGR